MSSILKPFLVVSGLILFAAPAAHATAFRYAETFDVGQDSGGNASTVTVSGAFDGTASGNLITGISGVSLFFNGVEAADPATLFLRAYNAGGYYDGNAVLSFDGLQNNFLLSNLSDPASMLPSLFLGSFTGIGSGNPDIAYDVALTGYNNDPSTTILAITEVAVPEPVSVALLGAGMVGAGLVRRRRGANG